MANKTIEIDGIEYPAMAAEGCVPGDRIAPIRGTNSTVVFSGEGKFKGIVPLTPPDLIRVLRRKKTPPDGKSGHAPK